MKRIVPVLLFVCGFALVKAQCAIDTSIQSWGFHPDTGTVLKHACAGSYYEDVIQIFAPEFVSVQLGTFPVNYVQLDSMQGLPGSLTYATNPSSGYMAGGERGCISIYGLADAPVGVYQFTIFYSASFMFLGSPNVLRFVAPYKIQIDSGTVTFSEYADTACSIAPYYFNNQWLVTPGNYTDTLTNQAGCDSVVTLHLAVIDFDTTVTASYDTLFAPPGYENYKLFNCTTGDVISDGTANILTAPIGCCYAIAMSNHGCTDTSQCFEATAISTGISSAVNTPLRLSPTIAANSIVLQANADNALLVVYDVNGKQVLHKQLSEPRELVDISMLQSGIYVASVATGSTVMLGRFIKLR
jgi:hypothetical protein